MSATSRAWAARRHPGYLAFLAHRVSGVLLAVSEAARNGGFGLLHWLGAPTWVTWVLAVVLLDGWMYLWHRLNHAVGLLWRFHSVHHSDKDLAHLIRQNPSS